MTEGKIVNTIVIEHFTEDAKFVTGITSAELEIINEP